VGLCLGEAFRTALTDRSVIRRLGEAHAVQDGSLARVVVDLGGRSWCHYGPDLPAVMLGNGFLADQTRGFVMALSDRAGFGIHADLLRGTDIHHQLEALFKALGLALRRGLEVDNDLGLKGTTSH
jgi:imidazoleglycerol-phosphate dehydratase